MKLNHLCRNATVILCMILLLTASAMGRAQASDLKVRADQLLQWSNGATVMVDKKNTNLLGTIEVTVSTKGLKKGTYSTYVFENKVRNWSEYGELAFSIHNETKRPLKFNVIATLPGGMNITVNKDSAVLLQRKAQSRVDLVYNHFGSIELEGGFQGTVRIPFASLQEENSTSSKRSVAVSQITSWGITTNLPENEVQKFRVEGIQLLSKQQAKQDNKVATYRIEGDLEVQRPYIGESTAQFRVSSPGLTEAVPAKFRFTKPMSGAMISPSGQLTLQSGMDAEIHKLEVRADIGDRWSIPLELKLTSPWTLNSKGKDGRELTIPSPGEVISLTQASDPWSSSSIRKWLRVGVITAFGLVLLIYFIYRHRARRAIRNAESSINEINR